MSGLVAGCTVPYLLAGEGPAPPGPRRPEHGPQSGARPGLRRSPDLAWAWGGRFAAQLATTMATVYLLYFLRDRIRLDDPARGVAVLSLLFTLGVIVASMAAGPLSDRAGRRKVFVSAASLLMATGLIIMAVVPVWTAALLAATALGAGYGVYFAIDQALVIEILPGESDRGRQLGVMNAAGSGAVALAPLIAAPIIPAGGYSTLYVLAACLAIAAAVFVRPIKSVA
jgi:MFS family permease